MKKAHRWRGELIHNLADIPRTEEKSLSLISRVVLLILAVDKASVNRIVGRKRYRFAYAERTRMLTSLAHGGAETKEYPAEFVVEQIQGGFAPIPVMQICLAWWLYHNKHITAHQFRVYFALQEMKLRRNHTKESNGRGGKRAPFYTPQEVAKLTGDGDSPDDIKAIRRSVSKLNKIGMVIAEQTSLSFARSPDQINVEDMDGFWKFWQVIRNRSRVVPVPRRTLRAIAKGFKKSTMGVLLAMLVRSIYWHKREGTIRVDSRTKASWIVQVFGICERSVIAGRQELRTMGWCAEIPVNQTMLNRYGPRDLINVDWSASQRCKKPANDEAKFAPPPSQKELKFAPPNKNRIPLSTKEDIKNRNSKSTANAASVRGIREKSSDQKSSAKNTRPAGPPKLIAIDPRHLADTNSLLELHKQAIKAGLSDESEYSRLRFFALAEHARSRGREPQKLFRWLLKNQKFEFVTQAAEDAANNRLKDHFFDRQNPLYERSPDNDNTLLDIGLFSSFAR